MLDELPMCQNMPDAVAMVHIVGGVLNTLLLTWLAHRRKQADNREKQSNGNGKTGHGPNVDKCDGQGTDHRGNRNVRS